MEFWDLCDFMNWRHLPYQPMLKKDLVAWCHSFYSYYTLIESKVVDTYDLYILPDDNQMASSRIQRSKKHRIPDPDPKHCGTYGTVLGVRQVVKQSFNVRTVPMVTMLLFWSHLTDSDLIGCRLRIQPDELF
jgi:hypothetical protein